MTSSTSTDNAELAAARKNVIPNLVKNKLDQGILAHSFSIKLVNNIEVVHYAAAAGYDSILIDLEHSSMGLDAANQLSCAALQVGLTPIVRVPANTSDWISRSLDGGAQAVIVPHVKNAKEAQNVVRYAKFPPLGERSATAGLPVLRYAGIPAKYANPLANEATLVICMIETQGSLDIVDEIAAVPGVDVLLIGSSDLTADMGIPGEFDHPRLAEAYKIVSEAAVKVSVDGRKLHVGIGGINGRPDLIEKFATAHPNARYCMSGADNGLLLSAMTKTAAGFKAITQKLL